MLADLHTHTTASDGQLSPADLVASAHAAGVEMLAITDHDTVQGITALGAAIPAGLRLIPGIELSANWHNNGIHIVGLNIDLHNAVLAAGIAQQGQARQARAATIAERLEKAGFTGVFAGARALANGDQQMGRPHFARYLADSGQIKDVSTAFKKYLGRGKCGDVRQGWPDLGTAIGWIRAAGGIAVLAHPAKYKLTNMKLEALCADFVIAGGQALEVVSGQQESTLTSRLARMANRHGLLASAGSDFHQPGQSWAQLGAVQPLPPDSRPVWQDW